MAVTEHNSLAEQVKLFSDAQILVMTHSAAIGNVMFMSPVSTGHLRLHVLLVSVTTALYQAFEDCMPVAAPKPSVAQKASEGFDRPGVLKVNVLEHSVITCYHCYKGKFSAQLQC